MKLFFAIICYTTYNLFFLMFFNIRRHLTLSKSQHKFEKLYISKFSTNYKQSVKYQGTKILNSRTSRDKNLEL